MAFWLEQWLPSRQSSPRSRQTLDNSEAPQPRSGCWSPGPSPESEAAACSRRMPVLSDTAHPRRRLAGGRARADSDWGPRAPGGGPQWARRGGVAAGSGQRRRPGGDDWSPSVEVSRHGGGGNHFTCTACLAQARLLHGWVRGGSYLQQIRSAPSRCRLCYRSHGAEGWWAGLMRRRSLPR